MLPVLTPFRSATAATASGAVKRHVPVEFDDVDTENVDPLKFFSASNKKVKAFNFDSTTLVKPPVFKLVPQALASEGTNVPKLAGSKRKECDVDAESISKRREPSPAPVPAGRSPKSKSKGILARRRFAANPINRVDPPAYAKASGVPFSIDAALSGTVPSKTKPRNISTRKSRRGWRFNIWEDTMEQELENMFNHSTSTLDISEDEGSSPVKGDRDNKENIAPAGYQTTGGTSRRDLMSDEIRSPLAHLDAVTYFADGCDTSSFVTVPVDETSDDILNSKVADPAASALAMTGGSADADLNEPEEATNGDVSGIEVWESESAKAEDEANALDELTATDAKEVAVIA